jgi:hypothetical protein
MASLKRLIHAWGLGSCQWSFSHFIIPPNLWHDVEMKKDHLMKYLVPFLLTLSSCSTFSSSDVPHDLEASKTAWLTCLNETALSLASSKESAEVVAAATVSKCSADQAQYEKGMSDLIATDDHDKYALRNLNSKMDSVRSSDKRLATDTAMSKISEVRLQQKPSPTPSH